MTLRDPANAASLVACALAAGALLIGLPELRLALAEASGGAFRGLVDGTPAGEQAALDVVRSGAARDPQQRQADLAAYLRSAPLSSGAWLDLAIARRAAGADSKDVVVALSLSAMTGPNEALLMAGRAGFTAPFWAALPADARRRLILDLVGGWGSIDSYEREHLSAIVQNAPEDVGAEIRASLLAQGGEGRTVAAALFAAAQP